MRLSLWTRASLACQLLLLLLLPRGGSTTTTNKKTTTVVFDVSRASRITCQTANDGCTFKDGSFGSIGSRGFSDTSSSLPGNNNVYDSVHYFKNSDGTKNDENYLELSSCWDFDCTAECDASCLCVNLATHKTCPSSSDDDDNSSSSSSSSLIPPEKKPPSAVFHLTEPHVFYDLQDVRLACTESQTQCVLSGFEGCGYTVPRYNLYNSESGLFRVDNVTRGDTELEIRGCNPVLGTATCDAGCTCHDLATQEPCQFSAARSPPPATPSSSLAQHDASTTASSKIVFDGLHEATFTCGTQYARCDEINGSNACGSSSSGRGSLAITTTLQPAALRVDQVQHWRRGTVTFSSCWDDTSFAMECDASCTCIHANSGRPCHCTDDASGQACRSNLLLVQAKRATLPLVALVLLGLFFKCICRNSSHETNVSGSRKASNNLDLDSNPPPSCEIEKISLVSGNE